MAKRKKNPEPAAPVAPKHTPGPWCVEAVNSEALHDVCLGYPVPGAGSPVLVAMVYADDDAHRPGDISNVEAEANARLIAAAPEMLAALEAAKAILASHIRPDDFDGHAARALVMVRDAIAKAKGAA